MRVSRDTRANSSGNVAALRLRTVAPFLQRSPAMADLRFLTLATDPNLVPGIYNGCDQWCHYCPATDRCLAYKCRPDLESGGIYENVEQKMFESMRYLKEGHEAEGLQRPRG